VKRSFLILFALGGLSCLSAQGIAEQGPTINSAVLFKDSLVCLNNGGKVDVWDLRDFSYSSAVATKLSKRGLVQLSGSGKKLWAVDSRSLYESVSMESGWRRSVDLSRGADKPQGLAIIDEQPLLILTSSIVSPLDGKVFNVPKLEGTFESSGTLRVLSIFSTASLLCIGTGNGEWGGELITFDPHGARWKEYNDALHYVTGITQVHSNELIVSWSMSHFMADTMIRIHGPDCKPVKEYPELESKYYEQITYSRFDKTLYGIESDHLVMIKDGNPNLVAKLPGRLYEREPNAIGVAPGVVRIFPIAEQTLIVVRKRGLPILIRDSKVTELHR